MSMENYPIDVITPLHLKELLSQENPPLILDVREPEELKICSFSNALHIPLRDLPHQFDKLPKNQMIVTVCHHGYRSLQAALFLKNHDITPVANLTGGIDAWAQYIDPSLKRY